MEKQWHQEPVPGMKQATSPEMPNTPDNGYTGCMQYNYQASTIQLA
jgi:hypothetical protein